MCIRNKVIRHFDTGDVSICVEMWHNSHFNTENLCTTWNTHTHTPVEPSNVSAYMSPVTYTFAIAFKSITDLFRCWYVVVVCSYRIINSSLINRTKNQTLNPQPVAFCPKLLKQSFHICQKLVNWNNPQFFCACIFFFFCIVCQWRCLSHQGPIKW